MEDLIPMGQWKSGERLIVGHNVSFDRSYIKEQYNIDLDGTRFLDTMSLHIAVSGLNQDQKIFAIRNGNPWNSISSLNNLNDVYKLYCQTEENVDKDPRNVFVKGSLADVYHSFQPLTDYCSNDVAVTLKILKSLFPTFVERFPHPVTLVGMMEMSVMYLPVNKRTWKRYLNESTSIYEEYKGEINQTLKEIACDSCSYLQGDNYLKDPWLWDLDWSTRPVGFKKSFELSKKPTKSKSNSNSSSLVETLMDTAKHLKKNQPLLPGYPKWFLEFCESSRNLNKLDQVDFDTIIESNQLNISPKLRAIPKLLKLMWNGFPLYHDKVYGWGYLVPDEAQLLDDESQAHFGPMEQMLEMAKANQMEVDRLKREEGIKGIVPGCLFFKLPHKDGPNRKVGNPLGKDFISKIADGTLRPFLSTVKDLVLQQNKISYWVNSSKRILSQLVIAYDSATGDGCIVPRVVVSGTVTRRAVEPTWLTASNSYADRLGSELKGIIQCPPGYCYVGADVDSQELWIAALIGDAHFSGIQGSTGLGWMTLRGDKAQGTDMHSVTANSINISRDEAKVLNYARIYGSGPDFAARFLRQSNPNLSEEEAKSKAKKIFVETKGVKRRLTHYEGGEATRVVRQWANGTESHMFNRLEAIATSEHPETPFLRGRISRALEPSVVGYDFMTSRINWVVQSSAVDFLHILLVCMKWLMAEFQIDGRFSISIHDEIRYIVREEHKYKAALALQLSNLLARAYFTSALQLNDLPASVAFFSSIEIDQCLRKDVHQDCKTPSNPLGLSKGYGVPAGESLSIARLVELLQNDLHFHQTECNKKQPSKERLTVTAS
ncbi:PREDICTED: DNA polymerase subunit gamma-1, mitochondrial-like [Rhagoletis zephyria]|uniref:DNA polymerase subunit gamma-1, mitochondrial-like n=1 Tax=Rhagoletis zephyria TaxID=28612 RepID=UPI0008112BC6|nr:PREDICTED: DNA polymerase subunit gamma-1, mitochondrial-like [Rhagoletis zephyria]